jgi:acetoin utilization protein AcuB
MKITEIMSSPPITGTLDDFLSEVKEMLAVNNIKHLVIIEEGKLMGVLSERDLLLAISPYVNSNVYTTRDLATLNQRVGQILERHPLYLDDHSELEDAIDMFDKNHISCIPIVDADFVPVGVVTKSDIIHFYNKKRD